MSADEVAQDLKAVEAPLLQDAMGWDGMERGWEEDGMGWDGMG